MKTLILAALFSLVFIPQGLAQTAAPAEAAPPTAASPCVVGLGLDVLWNDSWFPATVEAGPNETGQCQIGYDGYGDEWDEWVGADRMRPRSAECPVGGALDVLWNDSWFPATIEAGPNETGQCQIGYDGYGDEWDEWVGADRMRPRQ